jgi:deoxyribonuclease V
VIAAVDAHYEEDRDCGYAAIVVFSHWEAPTTDAGWWRFHRGLAPYEPGSFYLRELPVLLPIIEEGRSRYPIHTIVCDGYVDLGEGHPGLGRRLWEALSGEVEVIGVAKSRYKGAPAREVRRGDSDNPLLITATLDLDEAADRIRKMDGPHRIPTLLKEVDRLARRHPSN